jgi:hypothetical protein
MVDEQVHDIQARVDKLQKQIREFDVTESLKMDGQAVFVNGVDMLVGCVKFEARLDTIGEQFQQAISKWEGHIKQVSIEREEVIKRTQ